MNPSSTLLQARSPQPGVGPCLSPLVERLLEELAGRWRTGARPAAEEFFARYPELWRRPEAALELIAEELALRQECGEETTADELAARFPQWAAQVRALYDCQQALGLPSAAPQPPAPGEAFGEFRLLAEIGRGGNGRVFLATQSSLAGRAVVLKLAPDNFAEHLALARLQHTHIVPLYSAHEFPDLGLRALCMPYFGGASLDDLLTAGGRLPDALRRVQAAAAVPLPVAGPAVEFLDRAGHAEAVAWIGACLADALQYAHDRGLLHLDLKPSNVPLAADGTPMLLDFHLARPSLRAGEPAPAWLGGTLGYMAPAPFAAIRAAREAA